VKYIANFIKWRYHVNRGWTWVLRHLPVCGRNRSVLIRELDRTLVAQDVPACGEDFERYSLEWITGKHYYNSQKPRISCTRGLQLQRLQDVRAIQSPDSTESLLSNLT
jgi:hypothetical protein